MLYGECIFSQSRTLDFQNFLAEHGSSRQCPFLASVFTLGPDLYSFQWIRPLDACYLNQFYVIFLKVLLVKIFSALKLIFLLKYNITFNLTTCQCHRHCPSVDLLDYQQKNVSETFAVPESKIFFPPLICTDKYHCFASHKFLILYS